MSNYEIAEILDFSITARRSDGTYEKRNLTYPSDKEFYVEEDIRLDMFSLNRGEYGQIVSVKANSRPVYITYGELAGLTDYRFRYDDSIIRYEPDMYGNVVINFQIYPTYDPKAILVADQSQWAGMYTREAIMEIVLPGHDEPQTLYWAKEKVNTYNSHILGISCAENCEPVFIDLPDGVYSFTLKAADGSERQRSYLKTDIMRNNIDRMYITHALMCSEGDNMLKDNIRKAEFYLTSAAASMRLGNMIQSNEFYRLASKIIEGCTGKQLKNKG
jgi:hypothetical protein